MFGPDVPVSLTTTELRQLVEGVRYLETVTANPVDKDEVAADAAPLRSMFGQSVVARLDLPAGAVLSAQHLTTQKPGTGVPAARLSELIGARLKRSLVADEMVLESDLELVR